MTRKLLLLALAATLTVVVVFAQVSPPLANNEQAKTLTENKYRNKTAVDLEDIIFGTDARHIPNGRECYSELELLWTTEVGASVYSTPLITDLYSDGVPDLVVPTFTHFLESIELQEGHKTPGWPFIFPSSIFHTSPLLFDINHDGIQDIVVATENGEIVFFREDGRPILAETLRVPRLEVRKRWFDGQSKKGEDAFGGKKKLLTVEDEVAEEQRSSRSLLQVPSNRGETPGWGGVAGGGIAKNYGDKKDEAAAAWDMKFFGDQLAGGADPDLGDFMGVLSQEARESMHLFTPEDGVAVLGDERFKLSPVLESRHYHNYHNPAVFPEDDPNFVYVDAHILATPTIADLDGNGGFDLIVPVSYYFDRDFYARKENADILPDDINLSDYVASGLVVFDLDDMSMKFEIHLDLTTDRTSFRAYVYSSPTVADMDGDGSMDILVGTSVGFVYAFDREGVLKPGWPAMMDEVQGQVTVADLDGDGVMEIIACDKNANIVAFRPDGNEKWENRLSGFPSQGVVVGDVDGNGILDVVVGSNAGHIWALRGDTGAYLKHFPIKTEGRILAPALLTPTREPDANGNTPVSIVVPCFDGYVYVVDGKSGCVDKIDLGETAFAQVLAADVTGNGKLDLIVATMNGNIYALATSAPAHPLSTWTSQVLGSNGVAYRRDYHGIYVLEGSRGGPGESRDLTGSNALIHFEIVDNRPPTADDFRQYLVTVSLGDGSTVMYSELYSTPGVKTINVPMPTHLERATIYVKMRNEALQFFSDSFPVTFNKNFGKIMKWMIVVPFLVMAVVLGLIRDITLPLPK